MPITEQTLRFLAENRMRNSREWFHANKEDYRRYVLAPLTELSERLGPAMLEIDHELVVAPKVGKSISRIYRDTRFSKDKSLYRDVMWVVFARDKSVCDCRPGFVLELSPDGWRYGCGYYCAPARVMEGIRKLVLDGSKAYRRAQQAFDSQDIFQIEGECYKRPHYPGRPERERQWLERRNLDLMYNSTDFDALFAGDLHLRLLEGFQVLAPVYEFLLAAQGYTAGSEL